MTDMEQLARRAVACPGWRWMPGMLAVGASVNTSEPRTYRIADDDTDATARFVIYDPSPDLSDPATLGCLTALVREAWGGSGGTHLTAVGWRYYTPNQHLCSEGATEAGALVKALEAAGGEE